ncbi:MAG TPA: HEAT repeat domain-containing protein [Bryobacteraceae bacterium]|jgi:HEAT repeat protein
MDTAPQQSIQEAFANFAGSDIAKFEIFFRRMRQTFPDEVTEACLWYIAMREPDSAAKQMTQWLGGQTRYLEVLFDPESLSLEIATQAARVLREVDEYFFAKFFRVASELAAPQALRALGLLPVLGDNAVIHPLLRSLSRHSDEAVRSKAIELFCELRSDKIPIERQMASDEPRVRARALELLWYVHNPETTGIFRRALSDPHHRVVANALVGLHLQQDASAFPKMVELAAHSDPLVRSAIAWSFGYILDKRALPTLDVLSKDSSMMVRTRAVRSLLALRAGDHVNASLNNAAVPA